ncbi:IS1595 family transposase [Methylocapsa sp. S129]|uniref:IS1595 family transposase n=1 Tax=Methylocapsa sp. S129 TaxID=1641869 RepID=UPI00131BA3C9|nr:IS1595 family transposase [Methylocapsa sp. S129]
MSAELQDPRFTDETAAREALEAVVWPNGPVCPHCGNVDQAKIAKLTTKSARPGLRYCNECKGQFTATVGTVFERSKLPLTKWWLAMHLIGSSKKGISSHQLHRMLGISYKSTWFMMHRIREAMRTGGLAPMGGEGEIVEIDETFIGRKEGTPKAKAGFGHKNAVLSLVQRGGSVRSFHVDSTKKADIMPIIEKNIAKETHVMTDEAIQYRKLRNKFAKHDAVDHGRDEWGYTDRRSGTKINTNTIEGYYSIFKRGMKGVYQHCGEQHLHRYLSEFDFRYNNRSALGVEDWERVSKIAAGITGKRLTYRRPDEGAHA